MTRARVTAAQATRPSKGMRMLRGTVTALTPLTVQIAGGGAVAGLPVPGATYTVGGQVLILAQEPAVGPVYPIPGTTAVPGLPVSPIPTGTGAATGRFAMQLNSARAVTGNAWWDLPFDTYLSGQGGPMDRGDGLGVNLPWTGRYAILARAAVTGGDIATSLGVGIRAYRPSDGAVWAELGQWGARSELAIVLVDEITATAGDVIRFCVYIPATGRTLSYGNDAYRTRCTVRYLGPA